DLSQALTQQTSLGEVLRVIAASPTDLDRVLQEIVETAARLCEAPGASLIQLRERDGRLARRVVAGRSRGLAQREHGVFQSLPGILPRRTTVIGHTYLEGRTLHVADMAEAVESQYPDGREAQARLGLRTSLSVPLLRHGECIGVLAMHRFEV